MIKSPCKNCPKRQIGCHQVCFDYKKYKTDLNNFKDVIFKARQAERMTYGNAKRHDDVEKRKALYKCYKG